MFCDSKQLNIYKTFAIFFNTQRNQQKLCKSLFSTKFIDLSVVSLPENDSDNNLSEKNKRKQSLIKIELQKMTKT